MTDNEHGKRRVVGARCDADLLGVIRVSWLNEKALLMSGFRGQNGQSGWTVWRL